MKNCLTSLTSQILDTGGLERRILEINRKRVKVVKPGSKTSFPTTEMRGTYAPPFHVSNTLLDYISNLINYSIIAFCLFSHLIIHEYWTIVLFCSHVSTPNFENGGFPVQLLHHVAIQSSHDGQLFLKILIY